MPQPAAPGAALAADRPRRRRVLRPDARPPLSSRPTSSSADAEPSPTSEGPDSPPGAKRGEMFVATWKPTRMFCQAPHPAGYRGVVQHVGKKHNADIGGLPFNLEPTGRVLVDDADVDHEAGCFGIPCKSRDCHDHKKRRYITEFRVIAPGATPAEPEPVIIASEETTL